MPHFPIILFLNPLADMTIKYREYIVIGLGVIENRIRQLQPHGIIHTCFHNSVIHDKLFFLNTKLLPFFLTIKPFTYNMHDRVGIILCSILFIINT